MAKSPDAFRSIGEVAQLVGVAPHVLRYWEAQFPHLSPVKRADGRRYYRPEDVHLAAGLCEVLREEGLTIRGARRLISMDRGAGLRARGEQRLASAMGAPATPAREGRKAAPRKARARAADGKQSGASPDASRIAPDVIAADVAKGDRRTASNAPAAVGKASRDRFDPPPDASSDLPPTTAPTDPLPHRTWLARLVATATHLRGYAAPLSGDATALAARLRAARPDFRTAAKSVAKPVRPGPH